MTKLSIDIWSDVACPWCYVGKRRLEAALAEFPERDAVEIEWHAFELNPGAPAEVTPLVPYAERLAKKYGMSQKAAEARIASLVSTAKAEGLDFEFDLVRPGNTFDAHRVIHLGKEHGVQDAVKERLLRAYFTEGAALGKPDVLVSVAAQAGLDADEVAGVLASDAFADEVRMDERNARELDISGVPFFVFAGKYAVSGAQPKEVFARALAQSWQELNERPAEFAEGAVCGPDGCL